MNRRIGSNDRVSNDYRYFSHVNIFIGFSYISILLINWTNARVRRFSHGDGAFKFLRAYYEYQQEVPLYVWRNDQVTREYVNTLIEILARFAISVMNGRLYDSFTLFSYVHSVVCAVLYIGALTLLVKKLPINIALPSIFGICVLYGFASAFPDAEIIFATPIAIWITIAIIELTTRRRYSVNNLFAMIFLAFFGQGIHEALILVVSLITLILLCSLLVGKIEKSPMNLVITGMLVSFSVLGSYRILINSIKAPTRDSIFHASVFNPKEIFVQPSVFIVFFILFFSIAKLFYVKEEAKWKVSLFSDSTFLSIGISILLSSGLIFVELRRTTSHWSFTANRIDLMWYLILLSFGITFVLKNGQLGKSNPTKLMSSVLVGALFAMLLVRSIESNNWENCKLLQSTVVKANPGVLTRDQFPIGACDWGWTDPGTYLLLNQQSVVLSLPPGDENVFPDPRISDSNVITIFEFDIRIM